jgi:hypothetical protein
MKSKPDREEKTPKGLKPLSSVAGLISSINR